MLEAPDQFGLPAASVTNGEQAGQGIVSPEGNLEFTHPGSQSALLVRALSIARPSSTCFRTLHRQHRDLWNKS